MTDRLSVELRRFSGARAVRITDGADTNVPQHAHEWPVLSLYVMGTYENRSELGLSRVSSPSAMFYRVGEVHSNVVSGRGLEQIDIEFDPGWAGLTVTPDVPPVRLWRGGEMALAARKLAELWSDRRSSNRQLSTATKRFLVKAFAASEARQPAWIDTIECCIDEPDMPCTQDIARKVDLSAGWLREAYRAAVGEGIGETMRRKRVEVAADLLRRTTERQACVAAAAGFCDQSQMIHAFRAVLGRTPNEVRSEWWSRRSTGLEPF